MIYQVVSWVGIFLLICGHVSVTIGISKKHASKISGFGALLSFISALGLGVASVAALNAIWALISFYGGTVKERKRRSGIGGYIALVLVGLMGVFWLINMQWVAWLGSGIYVGGWFLFSIGHITRKMYLWVCLCVAFPLVPALFLLGAHAFAFNETIGAIMSGFGIWQIGRLNLNEEKLVEIVEDVIEDIVPNEEKFEEGIAELG